MMLSARSIREDWRYPTLLFITQRILLSGLGLALYALGYVPVSEDPVTRPYFGIPPETAGISGALLGVWQRFDVIHFLRIAKTGYTDADLTAFFPLFPLLSRSLGKLLGDNYLLSSFVLSNLSCLIAITAIYFWMLDEGYDRPLARRTILFLIWFPTSFFLFVPYSESLFLLFAALGIWSSRKGRWLLAGAASALATLTRIGGVVLSAVILTECLTSRKGRSRKESVKAWLSPIMPLIAYAGLALWRSKQNLPSLMDVQAMFWHRFPAMPWKSIIETIARILQRVAYPIEYLDLLVVLGMLYVGIMVLKRLPLSLAVYHWGLLILGLSPIRIVQPLSSQARFAVALFPAFIVLAQSAQGPIARRAVAYTFLALNLYLAGQFILWGWVG